MAHALAAEGAAVGLIARSPAGLAAAAQRLAHHDVPVTTSPGDVSDPIMLNRAVNDIAAKLGGLNHLVANASTRTRTAFTTGAMRLGAHVISYGPGDLPRH